MCRRTQVCTVCVPSSRGELGRPVAVNCLTKCDYIIGYGNAHATAHTGKPASMHLRIHSILSPRGAEAIEPLCSLS